MYNETHFGRRRFLRRARDLTLTVEFISVSQPVVLGPGWVSALTKLLKLVGWPSVEQNRGGLPNAYCCEVEGGVTGCSLLFR